MNVESNLIESVVNMEEPAAETPEVEIAPESQAVVPVIEAKAETPAPEHKENAIPTGLYVETRKRAIAAEKKAQELQEQIANFERQLNEFRNQKPPAPTPEDDPFGYLQYQQKELNEKLGGQLEQVTKEIQQRKQAERQAVEVHSNVQKIAAQEAEFVASSPDYYDALNYVREVQKANLMDYGLDQEQVNQFLTQQEYNTGLQALANGQNPAKLVYNMAKRFGYAKQPTVAAPAPAAPAQPSQADLAKMQTLEKGMQAAKSLGSNGVPDTVPSDDEASSFSEFDSAFKALGYKRL